MDSTNAHGEPPDGGPRAPFPSNADFEVPPLSIGASPQWAGESATAGPPVQIGPYRVLRKLGEGGMGTVYEALLDRPRQIVALKIVRPGIATPAILRRFELEQEILARLQHPGIARIYYADVVDTGAGPQPYFVMERVDGIPLSAHAAGRRIQGEAPPLTVRERLLLVAKIADAVQHAHQKGIIHRDLKPGNILVTDDGQPKILDFGVARATDCDVQLTTQRTDVGQIVGTLPYMSPEQARGAPDELDTRSDIYSLGVTAFELLTDQLPYDLRRRSIPEAARIIVEEEPTRLSSLNRALRGDIETIIGKALAKEKEQRYASASDLAEDIHRFLHDEPIRARRPGTWEQFRKFSRRNKALVGGATAAFFALFIGLIASTKLYIDAERQRFIAERVSQFLEDMLSAVAPGVARGRDTELLREIVDGARSRIENGELRSAPEADVQMRLTLGNVYHQLGKLPEAIAMLRTAAEITDDWRTDRHDYRITALVRLGIVLCYAGHPDEAEPILREAIRKARRRHGDNHRTTASTKVDLANLLLDIKRFDEGEALVREALAVQRALLGDLHVDVGKSLNSLALLLLEQNRLAEAESAIREALKIDRAHYGAEHPFVSSDMNNLALILKEQNRISDAEEIYREVVKLDHKLLGPTHPDLAYSLNNLAELLRGEGRHADAVPYFQEALNIFENSHGPDYWQTADVMRKLGESFTFTGRFTEAEPLLLRAMDVFERSATAPEERRCYTIESLIRLYTDWIESTPDPERAAALEHWRDRFRAACEQAGD